MSHYYLARIFAAFLFPIISACAGLTDDNHRIETLLAGQQIMQKEFDAMREVVIKHTGQAIGAAKTATEDVQRLQKDITDMKQAIASIKAEVQAMRQESQEKAQAMEQVVETLKSQMKSYETLLAKAQEKQPAPKKNGKSNNKQGARP